VVFCQIHQTSQNMHRDFDYNRLLDGSCSSVDVIQGTQIHKLHTYRNTTIVREGTVRGDDVIGTTDVQDLEFTFQLLFGFFAVLLVVDVNRDVLSRSCEESSIGERLCYEGKVRTKPCYCHGDSLSTQNKALPFSP
jgi:hypothetical protein